MLKWIPTRENELPDHAFIELPLEVFDAAAKRPTEETREKINKVVSDFIDNIRFGED